MIKKLIAIAAVTGAFLFLASPTYAFDNLHLGSRNQLNSNACNKEGRIIIDAVEKVKNDVDSGFAGNWAIDNYTREIKVWQTKDNDPTTWCAVVKYDGNFNAVAGQTGPGGTGIIGKNVKGELHGGYRATFTGTLKTIPQWRKFGFVGNIDYHCNITGSTCNYVSWTDQYFDNVTNFDQPWWGWIYNADKHHGTWLNQINVLPANSGNIL